ncbi:DUF1835 domain-containing protein [Paenibacillus sp. MMS20-IR301]|uniref:DUF1835 domain-containing protein n=1 Tax=Paenibacillus sp. MMS20-IR301 TaxID=2895946 RepID=UPI0028EB6D69|nr:DUF1835 domain-containing protein [Paenibacillus sp. MMS20-IR301]WNS45892.1 DUF1835 domain-containing protein [Paenibacillus sp. MMS20-IR301]
MKELTAIKKAVSTLQDAEVKSYLRLALAEIMRLQEQSKLLKEPLAEGIAGPVAGLMELYNELMAIPAQRAFWDPAPDSTHVHIVTGDSFAGSMKQALRGLGWTEGHKIITLRENYATGPLGGLDTPGGREARSRWFRRNISEYLRFPGDYEEEYSELLDHFEQIAGHSKVVIWTSSNACEQTALRLAVHLLGSRPNPVVVSDACMICEELFNRPDASIKYISSGEIPADKLQEALLRSKDCSSLSAADRSRFAREWQSISERSGALRIWQDGAVLEVPADYYDAYLLEKLDGLNPPPGQDGFLKSARLVGEALGYCGQYVGDAYFEHRVRELVYSGILEIKGVPSAMRFYSIRRKQAQ